MLFLRLQLLAVAVMAAAAIVVTIAASFIILQPIKIGYWFTVVATTKNLRLLPFFLKKTLIPNSLGFYFLVS